MDSQGAEVRFTLLNMFHDGGAFMYPLVLCSLFALGVIIAKMYALVAARRASKGLLMEVESLLKANKLDEAIHRCEETPGPVAAILLSGLRRVQDNDLSSNDVESVETIKARVRKALKHVDAKRIILAPDCGMKYLSREAAFGKLSAMAQAGRELRAEYGG